MQFGVESVEFDQEWQSFFLVEFLLGGLSPVFESLISGNEVIIEDAPGVIEVPVGIDDIADEVSESDFKVCLAHLRPNSGDFDAIGKIEMVSAANDPVDVGACASQQGLSNLCFELCLPDAGRGVSGCIAGVKIGGGANGELRAGSSGFGQLELVIVIILQKASGTSPQKDIINGAVVFLEDRLSTERGIKLTLR